MNKKDIQAGKIYCNRGAGTTYRKVLDMGMHIQPNHLSATSMPNEPVVIFETITPLRDGKTHKLYLKSFASWAGKEV